MSVFTLLGGILVFGICWLFIPRTSFVVALVAALHLAGIEVFPPDTGDVSAIYMMTVIILVGFVGGIMGLLLDIVEHISALE